MKCPVCDGTGTSNTCVNGTFKPCSFCDGTGEVKDNLCETCGTICPFDDEHLECDNYTPLTNEGWLRTATTEQLAEAIYYLTWFHTELDERLDKNVKNGCYNDDENIKIVTEWLKQPHQENE